MLVKQFSVYSLTRFFELLLQRAYHLILYRFRRIQCTKRVSPLTGTVPINRVYFTSPGALSLTTFCTTYVYRKEYRQCVSKLLMKRVRVTIVAKKINKYCIF